MIIYSVRNYDLCSSKDQSTILCNLVAPLPIYRYIRYYRFNSQYKLLSRGLRSGYFSSYVNVIIIYQKDENGTFLATFRQLDSLTTFFCGAINARTLNQTTPPMGGNGSSSHHLHAEKM